MGYTRYWERTDKELTVDFIEAVKEIIADCESKGIHICGGYGEGEPVVRLDKVWINGDASKDLDHETIYFDNEPSTFEFCKTARKPYDYALRKILEVAEEEGLVTDVRSDGRNDEIINDDGFVIGSTVKTSTRENTPFGNWLGESNGINILSDIFNTNCTKKQARAAVTTYCILFGIEVDTREWDELISWIDGCYNYWFNSTDELDEFMCEDLV